MSQIHFIEVLESIIQDRLAAGPDGSYTARLAAAGTRRIAQKVGEEGVEVALASVQGNKNDILLETSDLMYHLLVMLHHHDLSLADVVRELKARHD